MSDDHRDSVLILNGSHAEIPLINAAHELGFRVITSGADPTGLGHPYADAYVPADFSDADSILAIARDQGVVGVISACNDFAAITAARVTWELGLPGHDTPDTCITLHHKDKFRSLMEALDLAPIRSVLLRSTDETDEQVANLRWPLIVKPVDLTGGKGMTVCHTPDDLAPAVERALEQTRADYVVIEEYLAGTHHGFTSFIEAGKVTWWFADDEQYFLNPLLVAGTSTPSSLPSSAINDLVNSVEVIATECSLTDGLVHIQCIITEDGPHIIELCRRCPGDLYPDFVNISTGHDYASVVVRSELGLSLDIPDAPPEPAPTVRYCAMAAADGYFQELSISSRIAGNVVSTWSLMGPEAPIKDHLTEKQAIIFLRFPTMSEVQQHLNVRDADVLVAVRGW